jgi:competence protein ComEA
MRDNDTLTQINAFDTLVNEKQFLNKKENISNIEKDLFVFNPNTISSEEALKLGFSKKLAATLINFRNKGGKFFKPEDLKKLYGLSPKLFQTLESYILIQNNRKEFKKDSANYKSFPKKMYTKTSVELNSADSLSIVYLKGIGPSFTKRIIKYRTMLGGFHNINQLKEVYGMTDSLFLSLSSQVQIDKTKLTPIPINVIDLNSLRKHPYFNFQTAQAIINFRFKHGKLTEKDIIDLGIFNSEKLSVILPYLSY